MNCPKCGTENVENASHCMTCGAELRAQQPQQSQIQIQKFIKPAIIAVAGIIAVIIVISIFSSLFSSDKYVMADGEFIMAYTTTDDDYVYLYDGEEVYKTDKYIADIRTTADLKVCYVLEYDEDPYDSKNEDEEDKGGSLVRIDKKGGEVVAEGVKSIKTVSLDGKYVYYTNADDKYCQFNGKEETELDIDLEKEYVEKYAMSNNGKYFVYSVYNREAKKDSEGKIDIDTYIFNDGETTEVEEDDFYPISITDNGKKLYGYKIKDEDKIIYSLVKGEATKIGTANSDWMTNYDNTQILYYNDGDTYVCLDFETNVKLGGGSWNPVVPSNAIGINDFQEQFYRYSEDGVNYLAYFEDEENITKKAAKLVSYVTVSEDGETAYFIKNYGLKSGDLCCVEAGDLEEIVEIADDVCEYDVTIDGEYIYFINEDDEACAIKAGKSKDAKEKIADDAESIYIADDGCVYIKADSNDKGIGTLLYTKGDKKAEKVADDVYRIYVACDLVAYSNDYDSNDEGKSSYTINLRKSKDKFEKLAGDVTRFGY